MTNFINKLFRDHFNVVPDFERVKVPDKAYVELYNKILKKGAGRHEIHIAIGKYNLMIDVVVTTHEEHTYGGSDDYGNYEPINLSSYEISVIDYGMIDIDLAGINCNFDVDAFENMFT